MPVGCPSDCGDCNADLNVTVNELITCVSRVLDPDSRGCPECDVDRDGQVSIIDLIAAVRVAINEADLLLIDGTCDRPCQPGECGPAAVNGLEPCGSGLVRFTLCSDENSCGRPRAVSMQQGRFCLGVCRFDPPLLVFEDETALIAWRLGPSGFELDQPERSRTVRLSPLSTAAVQLVDQVGVSRFDDAGLLEVNEAVQQANRDTDFAGLSTQEAAMVASDVAAQDPEVVAAVDRNVAITIRIGNGAGPAGGTARVAVSLSTGGAPVAGTQNDILFGPDAAVAALPNGRPDCQVNAAIGKGATTFGFLPPGCLPGTTCTGVRALVVSLGNTDPIPNRSTLYTCRVAIAAGATGTLPLTCAEALAAPPAGGDMPVACTAGAVTVTP